MRENNENQIEIVTNHDRNISAIKAGLKLIPGVGESLQQLIFGKAEEAQQRRLDATLREVADRLKERGLEEKAAEATACNEDFAEFYLAAAQPIASATKEDKRKRLRDLLYNSMFIPPGDPGWEESMYCLDLLKKLNVVGLYVIATLARAERDNCRVGIWRPGNSTQWVTVATPSLVSQVRIDREAAFENTAYDGVLVTKEIKSLEKTWEMIVSQNYMVSTGSYSTSIDFYNLTRAGRLLVKWTLDDF